MMPSERCQAPKTTHIILHGPMYMTNGKSKTVGWKTDQWFSRVGCRKEGLTLKGHVGIWGVIELLFYILIVVAVT